MTKAEVECPDCGCQQYELAGDGMFGWSSWQRNRCEHCGRVYDAPRVVPEPGLPAVEHSLYPACSGCGSRDTRVVSTYRKSAAVIIRTYLCKGCGGTFRAVGSS